jgi:protein-tyrosine-phosphatase
MHSAVSSLRSPDFFKLLGNEVRWKLLTLLARSDYCNQELVRVLQHPQNLVSYHLGLLRELGLLTEHRSTADERTTYYGLNLERFSSLYFASGDALHPALDHTEAVQPESHASLPYTSARVLFLCTQNSARSQMAEGILRHLSGGRIEALSAGSRPQPVHPLAVRALAAFGIDISQQHSKHLDEMKQRSFDYIVTVCDRVREACPTFPDDPERIHWSISDPVAIEGSEEERYRAFEQVALELMTRLRYLVILIDRESR